MKRVAFSTVSPSVDDGLNTSVSKNGVLGKKKASKKKNDEEYTLRFEIVLSQDSSTSDDCAEFSFKEMIKDAEAKNHLPGDPESVYERHEDEKMKEMAKRLEAKYAPKKKRRDDYIDKGAGYDENDSFIDNDEAYDELIPSTLTTKYGGFYINCGKLEFRQCSDNEDDEMISENGDEDSNDFRAASKKRKSKSNLNSSNKRQKKVIESEDSKSNDNSRDLDDEEEDESESDEESSDDSDSSEDHQQPPKQLQKKKLNNSKPLDPNQQIASIIDSVINTELENSKDDPYKIPDELPGGSLRDKLNQLKEMKLNQQDKKQRFFSEDVNKILLSIDSLLQSNGSSKNRVIAWLTGYLQVSRETLLKRIKSSKRTHEESKLKKNVANLRAELSYVIVEHEEQFEAKRNKWEDDKRHGVDTVEPMREFKFNDKIKDLLKKILNSKRILVELDNIKGKQEEDNITNFFNNEIKNIWPPNWVSNKILLRIAGFISKYNNQTSDGNKSSVSVINNKKSQQSNNNQPLNLNLSKLQSSNNSTNMQNNSKVKQNSQQPKDLSMEKSTINKQDLNIKTESLLAKRSAEQQLKSMNHLSSKHHNKTTDVQSYNKQEVSKHYRTDDNLQQQFSIDKLAKLDQLNEPANNLNNLSLRQQQINQQLLKEQQQKQHQQKKLQQQFVQQQQQFVNQQQKSSQSKTLSYDTVQNTTNLLPAHSPHSTSLPLNSSVIRPHSSSTPTPNSSLSGKKYFDHQQQKMFTHSTPNNHTTKSSSSKQTMNKSPLEVDYKFEKAIQKSLIEDSSKQMNQYHQRSNSFSNSNNVNQSQAKQPTMTPKPAHSNNSTPSHSQNAASINLFNHPSLIQQLAMKQWMTKLSNSSDDAIRRYLQQSNSLAGGHERKSTDLSSNTSNLNSSYNNFGNYTGNNSTNQSQQQQQISQAYVSNSSNVASVTNVSSNATASNLVASSVNFKVQQQKSLPEIKIKNEFDVSSIMGNRYPSPNLSNATTNLGQTSYQSSEVASHTMNNHAISGSISSGSVMQQQVKPTSIYSDYMNNLNPLQQQQLYQRTIQQRQDDSKRK